jgi:hypothetical protein
MEPCFSFKSEELMVDNPDRSCLRSALRAPKELGELLDSDALGDLVAVKPGLMSARSAEGGDGEGVGRKVRRSVLVVHCRVHSLQEPVGSEPR